ncbi:MAG: Hint domain-containing protein [Pseudomonadota bacterium]
MTGYISEIKYYGVSSTEFVEVALPAGTDPSGYSVQIYMVNGALYKSLPLGASTGTMAGHDVYVIDQTSPGFPTNAANGNFYPDDAVALIDPNGQALQFLSYMNNTVTGTSGPVSGMTSVDVGDARAGQSLQSDDGGASYYVQDVPNSGVIPVCFAKGTRISTPHGARRIEDLRPGDLVTCAGGGTTVIQWIGSWSSMFEAVEDRQKPVQIKKGALGPNCPSRDLVVSGQHRIAVGMAGQLSALFREPWFVPAKALAALPRIRVMAGKRSTEMFHLLCAEHAIILAEGAAAETLLLGDQALKSLGPRTLARVASAAGQPLDALLHVPPALPCKTVAEARAHLAGAMRAAGKPLLPVSPRDRNLAA